MYFVCPTIYLIAIFVETCEEQFHVVSPQFLSLLLKTWFKKPQIQNISFHQSKTEAEKPVPRVSGVQNLMVYNIVGQLSQSSVFIQMCFTEELHYRILRAFLILGFLKN